MPTRLLVCAVLAALLLAVMGQTAPAPLPRHPEDRGPLRVLLAGKTQMRNAQFLRTLLNRQMEKEKAVLTLYFQPDRGQSSRLAVVSDILPDRVLKQFPSQFGKLTGDEESQRQ